MAETAETIRLLVISREDALLHPLSFIKESNSWHLEAATSGWEAMERVQSESAPHLLLLDLPRGEKDSLHLLRWLRRLRPELPVVVTCHLEDENKKKEAIRLGWAVATVLRRAIDRRGSSIRNYVGGSGLQGEYQNEFRVYGRTGQPCPRCRNDIARIRLAGRSTHYCPSCQRS